MVAEIPEKNPHGDYPMLRIDVIPTEQRHIDAFRHKHPMEQSFVTGMRLEKDGKLWLDGVEVRETYTLETAWFPWPIRVDVTGLKRAIASQEIEFEVYQCQHSQEWHDYIAKTCGVEEPHVARLTTEQLERPAIMMMWDRHGTETSTVDGAHRIVRRWRDGLKTFEMVIVQYEHARRFVTHDAPPLQGDGKGRFA